MRRMNACQTQDEVREVWRHQGIETKWWKAFMVSLFRTDEIVDLSPIVIETLVADLGANRVIRNAWSPALDPKDHDAFVSRVQLVDAQRRANRYHLGTIRSVGSVLAAAANLLSLAAFNKAGIPMSPFPVGGALALGPTAGTALLSWNVGNRIDEALRSRALREGIAIVKRLSDTEHRLTPEWAKRVATAVKPFLKPDLSQMTAEELGNVGLTTQEYQDLKKALETIIAREGDSPAGKEFLEIRQTVEQTLNDALKELDKREAEAKLFYDRAKLNHDDPMQSGNDYRRRVHKVVEARAKLSSLLKQVTVPKPPCNFAAIP